MRTLTALVFTFLFTSFYGICQSDEGKLFNIQITKVNKDVYILKGKGGNIGLSIGDDGIFMIDDQFAEASDEILESIAKLSKKPIQFLINTHFHGDHTGGNANIAKTGAVIVSHENVRTRLENLRQNESKGKIDKKTLPMITFKEDMTFHYNGEDIYAFHIHNSHTDGDVLVYFTNSNVLHTGDTYLNAAYPYLDLENGGSLKGYMDGLNKIMMVANEDTQIIPGHGDVATVKDVIKMADMLAILEKKVTQQYYQKKTEDEVARMTNLTAEYDEQGYGKGFINNEKILRAIYKEVEKNLGKIDNRSMEERLQEKLKKAKAKN